MRSCATPWHRSTAPPPERRHLLALLACLLVAGGCVTRGTHDQVVAERDSLARAKGQLEGRVALLAASNESLHAERLTLINQTEDLRQERAALERDVGKLRASKESLSDTLHSRETELSKLSELTGTYEGLVADLEEEVASGQIEIEQLREGLRLNVSDEILFASGSAELGEGGRKLMRKVAVQIQNVDYRVEVQGHTDNLRIGPDLAKRYPTNWELAGARAAQVARALQKAGVKGARLTAVSYAQHRPIASNKTAEGRTRNRRIEIRLLPPAPETGSQ